jgi:hypothetical protein
MKPFAAMAWARKSLLRGADGTPGTIIGECQIL